MADTFDKRSELDAVFAALAHDARRHILLAMWFRGGLMSAGEIATRFAHSWPTTTRHLRVLEEAGMLEFAKVGRSRVYKLSHARLQIVHDWLRWFQQEPPAEPENGSPAPERVLRNIALAYPEALEEETPGQLAILVKGRPFAVLNVMPDSWTLTVRLPTSHAAALQMPFAAAVNYRLGKSDWVVARFSRGEEPPIELLWEWIDESYRSAAPKRLLSQIPGPLIGAEKKRDD